MSKKAFLILVMCAIGLLANARDILIYCSDARAGLNVAECVDGDWKPIGQLCGSDYGKWGKDKRMYSPVVIRTTDGAFHAVWHVNDVSPVLALAYSADLITWRPQDYPEVAKAGGLKKLTREEFSYGGYKYTVENGALKVTDLSSTVCEPGATQKAHIRGHNVEGYVFSLTDSEVEALVAFHKEQREIAKIDKQSAPKNDSINWWGYLTEPVVATLVMRSTATDEDLPLVNPGDELVSKPISDKIIGVFFEDINFAADGGLYAELIQNRDFEYCAEDHEGWNAITAWKSSKKIKTATAEPLSANNPHYVVLGKQTIANEGWDGFNFKDDSYKFSIWAKCIDCQSKTLTIQLVDGAKNIVAEGQVAVNSNEWKRYELTLKAKAKGAESKIENAEFRLTAEGSGSVALDMISLFPGDTFKGHGLRTDLAQAIADLKPKFVRFPGGCMSHGDGIQNIYRWPETVGEWQDRMPRRNIWNYHQTRGLGFEEYFQFCQDIDAEPLPVLAAGVPCQNSDYDENMLGGQQSGIPMEDMPAYCQELVDLIAWAKANYKLNYIGIGNEDIISYAFKERYEMICKAIKAAYPDVQIVGTAGPFHYPSSDYIEGWKFARENADVTDLVDEHYYESTGWYVNNQHYYDDYPRTGPKVYLGEYASWTRTMESALVEAMHLCHVEENGDVVVMTSYAPMLARKGHENWNPDMIYFDNESMELTPSYYTQWMFGNHSGDEYLEADLYLAEVFENRVATSVVRDSKTGKVYLKMVNSMPVELQLCVEGLLPANCTKLSAVQFSGKPTSEETELQQVTLNVNDKTIVLKPYSVTAVEL